MTQVIARGVDVLTGGYNHTLLGSDWPKEYDERNRIIQNAKLVDELIQASREALDLIETTIGERDPFVSTRLRAVLGKLK